MLELAKNPMGVVDVGGNRGRGERQDSRGKWVVLGKTKGNGQGMDSLKLGDGIAFIEERDESLNQIGIAT